MKKGFTIIEVSILFVIFLIVAFLVAPLSLDDTMQAKYTSKWRSVQSEFSNIFYSINVVDKSNNDLEYKISEIFASQVLKDIKSYNVSLYNGGNPNLTYQFQNFKQTYSGATLSLKFIKDNKEDLIALLLYDVNGSAAPNVWGKDVFGYNIYNDRIEPFGKESSVDFQKKDCSKNGTGLSCSNYYLIGGSFD